MTKSDALYTHISTFVCVGIWVFVAVFRTIGVLTTRGNVRTRKPRFREEGVDWCSLAVALEDDVYREFVRDLERNGRIRADETHGSLPSRIRRKLATLSERLGAFQQARLGPRWPYLE